MKVKHGIYLNLGQGGVFDSELGKVKFTALLSLLGFCSKNQKLVHLFFENAKRLMNEEGEIHVTNKSVGFFLEWNIVTLASLSGLPLVEEAGL